MKKPTQIPAALGRRNFLGSVAVGSAALGLAPSMAAANTEPVTISEMHHHVVAHDDVTKSGIRPGWTNWSAERVAARNVRALLSYSAPGAGLESGRVLARLCNEHAVDIARTHAGQFFVLASLPNLNDTTGALQEISRVYAQGQIYGVTLMSSYGDRLLNDTAFAPVLDELNRRGALVYVQASVHTDAAPVGGFAAQRLDTAGVVAKLKMRWSNIRFSNASASVAGSGIPVHTYWWNTLPQQTTASAITLPLTSNVVA